MKKAVAFLLIAFASTTVFSAQKTDDFCRGIAYYLIGDIDLARKNLDAYFRFNTQPPIRLGFNLLLGNDKWEATKKFRDYLESDHRSLEALIGISLAMADMRNSIASDNLNKILRMNPEYSPAYLCLGDEFLKRKNYPAAEESFKNSIKFSTVPDYKILLGNLYLKTGQVQKALELIQPEADAAPANYYFALLSALAYSKMDNWVGISRYLDQALQVKPDSKDVLLLKAQQLLKTGELKKAKGLLEKMKFDYFNPEYSLTFAEVLLKLKDKDAEKPLYEVFSQNPWHPVVNKLLGLFFLKKNNPNVQNWINRAIISGNNPEDLKKEFPAHFNFPNFQFFPIFEIKKIQWLNNNRVLIAGSLHSGEKEKLLVMDAVSLKTIKTFEYEGSMQEMFASANRNKVIFSTTATENESVYIYTLITTADSYFLKPVFGNYVKLPKIVAGFNASGTVAYVTDGSLADLAFTSPFSTIGAYGRKTAIYPNYPFPVYSYTYASDRWAEIKDRQLLNSIPIKEIRQFLLVVDALQNNPDVAKILEKGRNINITSSEEFKIHFNDTLSHFVIYYSDLKNAFQGLVYDRQSNQTKKIDETMFLGEKYYAELDIVNFTPEKNEILIMTKDKEKNLILFNYYSLLYKKLGNDVLTTGSSDDANFIFLISERNKYLFFSEVNLEIVMLSPFSRRKVNSRRDLNAIVECGDSNESYFSTFNGELLRLDEEDNFKTCQVSLAGATYQPSPDKRKAAAFINGHFYVLSWLD